MTSYAWCQAGSVHLHDALRPLKCVLAPWIVSCSKSTIVSTKLEMASIHTLILARVNAPNLVLMPSLELSGRCSSSTPPPWGGQSTRIVSSQLWIIARSACHCLLTEVPEVPSRNYTSSSPPKMGESLHRQCCQGNNPEGFVFLTFPTSDKIPALQSNPSK